MFSDCTKQAQIVRVRARADAKFALVLGIGQRFVGGHIRLLHLDLVVDDHARAGGQAKPRDTSVCRRCAAQVGRNSIVEHLGLDGLKQAIDFTLIETGCIDQQDHVGRRRRAFCLEAGQDARVVRIHAVDLDAGCFGETRIQRFVRGIVASRVEIDHLVLGIHGARSGGQNTSAQQGFHGLRHGCIFQG
ncbi:hypothetical protein D3C72_1663230 [compost metagenome]